MLSRAQDLEQRLLGFAQLACEITERLPHTPLGTHISLQLLRCATSPAANYAEARSAESRRDFVHKMQVCLKELRESCVWLQLIDRLQVDQHSDLAKTGAEANQLIAIFMASVKTARRNGLRTGGNANSRQESRLRESD